MAVAYKVAGDEKSMEQLDLLRFTEWLQDIQIFDLDATMTAATDVIQVRSTLQAHPLKVVHRANLQLSLF